MMFHVVRVFSLIGSRDSGPSSGFSLLRPCSGAERDWRLDLAESALPSAYSLRYVENGRKTHLSVSVDGCVENGNHSSPVGLPVEALAIHR